MEQTFYGLKAIPAHMVPAIIFPPAGVSFLPYWYTGMFAAAADIPRNGLIWKIFPN